MSAIPQHKRMAMGEKVTGMKKGGAVKTGIPDSPMEKVKRQNGIPGMKAGGPCMKGLSPEAKARLFERRMKWLEDNAE